MSDHVDRERLRRIAWRQLEPELNDVWAEFARVHDYAAVDAAIKSFLIDFFHKMIDTQVDKVRDQLQQFGEPQRSRGLLVLQLYLELIGTFLGTLRVAIAS